jgi:hypothetical protein
LHAFVDGLDYRWGRWVLEYDMGAQLAVFGRVADAFRPEPAAPGATSGSRTDGRTVRYAALAAVLLFVALLAHRLQRLRSTTPAARESALYLKLRRTYQKRGYAAAAALAPQAFIDTLRASDAPGAAPAGRAVLLYARARFGGEALSDAEMQELRGAAQQAQRALRNARR